jgi:hypothetical protein
MIRRLPTRTHPGAPPPLAPRSLFDGYLAVDWSSRRGPGRRGPRTAASPFVVVGEHGQQPVREILQAGEKMRFAVHDALHLAVPLDPIAVAVCGAAVVVIRRPQPHQKQIAAFIILAYAHDRVPFAGVPV